MNDKELSKDQERLKDEEIRESEIRRFMKKYSVDDGWFRKISDAVCRLNDGPSDLVNSKLFFHNKLCEICNNLTDMEYDKNESIDNVINNSYLMTIKSLQSSQKMLSNTAVKCPKCGKRNAYYNSVQTRSADESSTRIYLCLECNNRWKRG